MVFADGVYAIIYILFGIYVVLAMLLGLIAVHRGIRWLFHKETASTSEPAKINSDSEILQLRRMRNGETNLIRYCVFDRAILDISRDNHEGKDNSHDYNRDCEVIHYPYLYANMPSTEGTLGAAWNRDQSRRQNDVTEDIAKAIVQLKGLLRYEKDKILIAVYEHAQQEREKQLNGDITDWQKYAENKEIIRFPHRHWTGWEQTRAEDRVHSC